MRTFTEGSIAPDFELKDQNGDSVRLSNLRGSTVVLYFYPKDDTPGCTKEACGFRDIYSDYTARGIKVVGISPDDAKKHTKFINKYQLPFTLLSDEDHQVCETYGVWALKKIMGKEYMGVLRTTFVIAADGIIRKIYENVKPEDHAEEILGSLDQ